MFLVNFANLLTTTFAFFLENKKYCNSKSYVSFQNAEKQEIIKDLNNLNTNKRTKNTNSP